MSEMNYMEKIGTFTYTDYRDDRGIWRCGDGGKTLCKFTQEMNSMVELTIPDMIGGVKITGINALFYGCEEITTINIPSSVEWIDGHFRACSKLNRVNIQGNNLKTIGRRTFSGCASLEYIDLPNGLEYIGDSAFVGCGLRSIVFPEKIGIAGWAFSHCKNLKQITISDDIYINDSAFIDCHNFEEINISPDAKRISVGSGAFTGSPVRTINIHKEEQLCLAAEILDSIELPHHTKTEEGGPDELPPHGWPDEITRFPIIDKTTHLPIKFIDKTAYLPIKIVDSSGSAFTIENEDDLKAFVAGYSKIPDYSTPPLDSPNSCLLL